MYVAVELSTGGTIYKIDKLDKIDIVLLNCGRALTFSLQYCSVIYKIYKVDTVLVNCDVCVHCCGPTSSTREVI